MSIEEYLNELKIKNKKMFELKSFVEEKTKQYQSFIESSDNKINEYEMFINDVKSKSLNINLGDLVSEISRLQGVPEDSLNVSLTSRTYMASNQDYPTILPWVCTESRGWDLEFSVAPKENPDEKLVHLVTPLNPNEIQRDGKTMFDHLVEDKSKKYFDETKATMFYTKLGVDDYRNISFCIPFSEMLNNDSAKIEFNFLGRAVKNVLEKDNSCSQMDK